MPWVLLCINVSVVMLAARLRYAGGGLAHAGPVSISPQLWWWLIGGVGAAGLIAGVADRRRLLDRDARVALAELLVAFVAFFVIEWAVLPAYQKQFRAIDYAAIGLGLALVAWLFWRDRRNVARWGVGGKNFLPAALLLAAPTIVFIAVPLAARQFVGGRIEPRRLLLALATYPVYALAQLGLFQVFLVGRLRRISDSAAAVTIVSAGMFALVHWPNGLVMIACAGPAAVWTLVYLKRPNLYALAISMGLSAAVLANVLPREEVLKNMRTGPIYVQRLIDAEPNR